MSNPLYGLMQPSRIGNNAAAPSRSPLMSLAGGAAAAEAEKPPERTVQVFPPWEYPIPSARAFYAHSYNNVIAAGTLDQVIPNLTFQVGNAQGGTIRSFSGLVLAPLTTMDLFFTIKLNGVALAGWDQLRVIPVNASAVNESFFGDSDVIRVEQNTTITVTVTNNSAGPFTVGGALGGWFWPSVDAERLMGGLNY